MLEHVLPGPGALVCRGHQGLGGAKPPLQAPVKGSKRAGAADDRLGRHAEGLCGTVTMLHGAALEHLATGDVMLGSEAQPRAEVLVIGPLAHVRADLGSDGLRPGIAHAVHGHERHTGNAQEMSAGVPFGGILAVRVGLATRGRGRLWQEGRMEGGLKARLDDRKGAFDLRGARADLDRVGIEERERLPEDKQVLCPPSPGEGPCHRSGLLLAAVIA